MKKLLIACLNILVGTGLGLGLLELTLHSNPALLLRGMGLPAPVDLPINSMQYEVRYSDADIFFWQKDQVRPIASENDQVEARVIYYTDEFGFPNLAPVPEAVDVVVLGRSFSIGAQASQPWPRGLAEVTGLKVLNLSQTGSVLDLKLKYLRDFGFPRQPKWVILEILPSMDIIGYGAGSSLLVPALPVPIIRQLAREYLDQVPANQQDSVVYPLPVEIAGQRIDLTFYSYYLAALTVDKASLKASNQWQIFEQGLSELVSQARGRSACVLLLYAPTKLDIYFQLATRPEQLAPALQGWLPWRLSDGGDLIQDSGVKAEIQLMQANAPAGRDLVVEFALEHNLAYVDPTGAMLKAARLGDSPFMVYDTHWSETGNRLVADLIAEKLSLTSCP